MNAGKSYAPPIGIGEVFRALAAGEVVESQHPGFAVGDYVTGTLGAQQYVVREGKLSTPKVHTEHGIENFLPTLNKLFSGENFGKLVLAP
jgi:NADPH-dependent curcumin reductase CurA